MYCGLLRRAALPDRDRVEYADSSDDEPEAAAGVHDISVLSPGRHANGNFSFGTFASQRNPLTRNSLSGVNDGFPIADMLLGTPQSGGVDWNANDFVYFPTWAIYAQDDWKQPED